MQLGDVFSYRPGCGRALTCVTEDAVIERLQEHFLYVGLGEASIINVLGSLC